MGHNKLLLYTGYRDTLQQIFVEGNYITVFVPSIGATGAAMVVASYTPANGKTFVPLQGFILAGNGIGGLVEFRNNTTAKEFFSNNSSTGTLFNKTIIDSLLGDGVKTYDMFLTGSVAGNTLSAYFNGYIF